jgi:hypothetical protein
MLICHILASTLTSLNLKVMLLCRLIAPMSPNNDTSETTKMVLCHTSVGLVLWKREKDNEMQKVELES